MKLPYGKGQRAILAEEEHGTAEKLLEEEVARLHLVQRDDDRLEELHVFISQWHRKATDDGCEDIKQLCGPVELMVLVNKGHEAVVDGLADHLASRHQLPDWIYAGYLRVQLMKDVLEVVALVVLLRVEQLQELRGLSLAFLRPG